MSAAAGESLGWRPPAPVPPRERMSFVKLCRTLWRNPTETWHQAHFEQPIVFENLVFGQVAILNDPGAIRRMLMDNTANYRKDALQLRVLSVGLKHGLLTVEGEQWRMQRRTLAPTFSRKTVIGFASAMMRSADMLAARWQARNGEVLDVADEMTRFTLDSLERTMFSDGLGQDGEEVRAAMTSYFEVNGRIDPFDLLGMPDWVPRLTHLGVRRTLAFLNGTIDALMERRRRQLAENPASVSRDILTLLLEAQDPETGRGMTEMEVRANLLTFMVAGQETTANLITWVLFLLSQSDEWRERVTAEAGRELDGPPETLADRLVETNAVIDEAMRLYPPITAISRSAIERDELAGHEIKPGTMLVISPYVLHRHRALWERPDIFDPTRFLEPARKSIDRFAYLPFGVGPRTCIGASFAVQQAKLVIAILMKNFDLSLKPGHAVWPLQRMTLRPADGLPMLVRARATAHRSEARPRQLARFG
jgi:cytochrome P450